MRGSRRIQRGRASAHAWRRAVPNSDSACPPTRTPPLSRLTRRRGSLPATRRYHRRPPDPPSFPPHRAVPPAVKISPRRTHPSPLSPSPKPPPACRRCTTSPPSAAAFGALSSGAPSPHRSASPNDACWSRTDAGRAVTRPRAGRARTRRRRRAGSARYRCRRMCPRGSSGPARGGRPRAIAPGD